MTDYDNKNSGALFKNDRKNTANHPDYRGECEIVCPDCGAISNHWLSAWIKDMRKGGKFMSLAFTVKEAVQQTSSEEFDDSDVPF